MDDKMPMGEDLALGREEQEKDREESRALARHYPALPVAVSLPMTPSELKGALADALLKAKMLEDAIRERLIAGVDYGLIHRKYKKRQDDKWASDCGRKAETVMRNAEGQLICCPDCGAKHAIWKGGAEKVCGFMMCTPVYTLDRDTADMLRACGRTRTLPIMCRLQRPDGTIAADGKGSATFPKEQDGDWDKSDAADNKTIKMAKKRALIDAVLGFGMSSVFTQDIETVADYGEESGERTPAQPRKAAPPQSAAPAGDDPGDSPAPPTPGDVVKGNVTKLQDPAKCKGTRYAKLDTTGDIFWTFSMKDPLAARLALGMDIEAVVAADEKHPDLAAVSSSEFPKGSGKWYYYCHARSREYLEQKAESPEGGEAQPALPPESPRAPAAPPSSPSPAKLRVSIGGAYAEAVERGADQAKISEQEWTIFGKPGYRKSADPEPLGRFLEFLKGAPSAADRPADEPPF